MHTLGITVYSCAPDEVEAFRALAPGFGVRPTLTRAPASDAGPSSSPRNRCISVGHTSELPESTLRALSETGVEYISTRSIGIDHIDVEAAASLGITVGNVAYAPDGVADYTVMLMLMAIRNAKAIVRAARNHDFRLGAVRGRELRDMTVGVVGVGRIGTAVIERLQGFGCRVLAHGCPPASAATAKAVSLDELLRSSDIVTLHLPLTVDTFHLVGSQQIASMKRGAVLINTARGGLVDTDALITALERGHLGGVALDVLEGEEGHFSFDCTERPIDNDLLVRLQELPNALLTPHTAFHTDRVLHEVVETTIANCVSFERSRTDG